MSNRELDSSKNKPTGVVWLDDTGGGEPPTDRIMSLTNVAEMLGVSRLCGLRYYEFRARLIRRRQLQSGGLGSTARPTASVRWYPRPNAARPA